ncbi:MAG: hypothetical protein P4L03_00430 [Terracidiphilus sp.]|nr:hypothetical protein [Terracidiphilus sp.]
MEELFHKVLELKCSPEERLAQVRAWTGDDVALAGEVLSLLD